MTGIYWLASYPKSGNTWLRLMVQACLAGSDDVDINALSFGLQHAHHRPLFDESVGVPAADLDTGQILAWRPFVVRALAERLGRPLHVKTHDMRLRLPGGEWLLPPDATAGAVYLVRDPRDVAPSLARHMGVGVDEAIDLMGRHDACLSRSVRRLTTLLPEYWGSWSRNVESWLAPTPFPARVVRYEDLRADPEGGLAGILGALGLAFPRHAVRRAVAATGLERLKAQEAVEGFAERPRGGPFFGDGRVGGWAGSLTARQAARVEAEHGNAMRRLGYLA